MQISTDLVFVNVQECIMEVQLKLARLLTRSESAEVNFKSRNVDGHWLRHSVVILLLAALNLFHLFGGICCSFKLLRISHLKDPRVLNCVVHHRAFVDHLRCNFEPDVECHASVRVHIEVNILELELIIECALLEGARPVQISSQLNELVLGPSCKHAADSLSQRGLILFIANDATQDYFDTLMLNLAGHFK